jgi:hypothetical protein
LGALAGAAGLGAAGVYGSTSAQAQASGPAGQQGTASAPNDMFAYNLDVQNGAQFNGSDLVGVGAAEVGETGRGNGNLWEGGSSWTAETLAVTSTPSDVSSTSYVSVADLFGGVNYGLIPDGATLYGRYIVLVDPGGNTMMTFPRCHDISNGTTVDLTELEISSSATGSTTVDSGWTEITTQFYNDTLLSGRAIKAKVDSGTGEFVSQYFQRVFFDWRVD